MAEAQDLAKSTLWASWPAPAGVQALTTTRQGGFSSGGYASLNLATHCGDDPAAVQANREILRHALQLPSAPCWMEQVHGCDVMHPTRADSEMKGCGEAADAAWTDQPGIVCAVLTADCLPVVLADRAATVVAVAHAGWRGLAAGVLEATLDELPVAPAELMAWLGPCIGVRAFEVGAEVREAFCAHDTEALAAFAPAARPGHWMADLPCLARQRLLRAGVGNIHVGEYCTFSQPEQFFSYRRDGQTGRMATLAWLQP